MRGASMSDCDRRDASSLEAQSEIRSCEIEKPLDRCPRQAAGLVAYEIRCEQRGTTHGCCATAADKPKIGISWNRTEFHERQSQILVAKLPFLSVTKILEGGLYKIRIPWKRNDRLGIIAINGF
jgi:hypothetical protein